MHQILHIPKLTSIEMLRREGTNSIVHPIPLQPKKNTKEVSNPVLALEHDTVYSKKNWQTADLICTKTVAIKFF